MNAPKKDKSYLIGEKVKLFQTNSSAKKYDELLGLDLKFLLPLPITKQIPGSISLQKRSVETFYQLFVSVVYGKQLQTYHQSFPVRIKRYDKLSTFGQFHIPLKGNVVSPDHLVEFEYSIPQSSFGPRDNIISYVKISPNLDLGPKSRKIKLQRLSVSVVEVITFNLNESSSSSLASPYDHHQSYNSHQQQQQNLSSVEKRRKLCKATNQLDIKLPENGYRCEITMDFPVNDLRDKDGIIAPMRADIPLPAYNGFTTACQLYKVDYLLVFKAKFSHSKDIVVEQPITVTPFDHVMCTSLMKNIKSAVDEANSQGELPEIVPKVYRPNDSNSFMIYGIQPMGPLSGNGPKPILVIR